MMVRLAGSGRAAVAALTMALTAAPAAAQDSAQPTLQKIRQTNAIAIAHRADRVPFAYLDAAKRPIGFSIDICNEIVNLLRKDQKLPQLRIEYVQVTTANRIEAVRSGKADMECGATINEADRRKEVAFAIPYYFDGPRILVRTDSGINKLQDLRGKRVVSPKGANAVPILRKQIESGYLSGTQLIEAKSNSEAFAMVENGEADAHVTTDNLLYGLRMNAKDPTRYEVVGDHLSFSPVAIVLRKDDPEFKRVVDRLLTGLMLDGAIGRFYTKWFQSPIPPKGLVLGIPMSGLLRDQLRWPSDWSGD